MKRIFVVEGPDGTGKTTLINAIREKLIADVEGNHITTLHFGAPKMNPFIEYTNALNKWLIKNIDKPNHFLLIDRFHIGERVYGTTLRAKSLMTFEQLKAIDDLLDTFDAVKIFAITPNDDQWEVITTRGDELFGENDKELVFKIANQWRAVMNEFENWKVYDMTRFAKRGESFDEYIDGLVK